MPNKNCLFSRSWIENGRVSFKNTSHGLGSLLWVIFAWSQTSYHSLIVSQSSLELKFLNFLANFWQGPEYPSYKQQAQWELQKYKILSNSFLLLNTLACFENYRISLLKSMDSTKLSSLSSSLKRFHLLSSWLLFQK